MRTNRLIMFDCYDDISINELYAQCHVSLDPSGLIPQFLGNVIIEGKICKLYNTRLGLQVLFIKIHYQGDYEVFIGYCYFDPTIADLTSILIQITVKGFRKIRYLLRQTCWHIKYVGKDEIPF